MVLIRRITDIKAPLIKLLKEANIDFVERGDILLGVKVNDETYIIDNKDQTGPIMLSNLRGWIGGFEPEDHLIFITMGYFHHKCFEYIIDEKMLSRVCLIGVGLRDFYDEMVKCEAFGEYENIVFDLIYRVFDENGIPIKEATCKHCNDKVVAYCKGCGALLSKSHFIHCPLCMSTLCHPDVSDCYYKHEC
ncbi:MAG: hypothetical protein ACUVWP_04780 [bacterium]